MRCLEGLSPFCFLDVFHSKLNRSGVKSKVVDFAFYGTARSAQTGLTGQTGLSGDVSTNWASFCNLHSITRLEIIFH